MWWALPALAAEPTVEVTDSGALRGVVEVAAPVDAVLALLRDPMARVGALGHGTTTVRAERDGDCWLEHTDVAHPVKAVSYVVRSCPTADGVRSALVSSADVAKMDTSWRVEATATGSRVTYVLDTAPTFPLPAMVVRMSARSGVTDALAALGAWRP